MITEILKVKPADFSFNLAVQKNLAMEQASKDVQVEQGPGISVSKLESVKFGTKAPSSHHKRLKVPEVRALDSPSLVTDVQDHITLKSACLSKSAVTTVA